MSLFQEQTISKSTQLLPSPINNTPDPKIENRGSKRKRSQIEATSPSTTSRSPKRPRSSTAQPHTGDTICEKIDPLEYWTKELRWPNEYFEPESNMNNPLARKKSSSTLCSRQFEAGSSASNYFISSDQKLREAKSVLYTHPSYITILETKGSFINDSDLGITDTSEKLCRDLLETEQSIPQDTLFRDDIFKETCKNIQGRNEAMIVQHISPLICPSALALKILGAKHLKPLHDSINEGWNSAIPFYSSRPQPDYSVGFGRSAFTKDQLEKLAPFVGEIPDTCTSYYMATWQMYLPFLTLEVKSGIAALDIADRQNAHSMTIAVRGIVELFKLVKREKELHREILAFSISHNDQNVRIYGHYPVIDEGTTTFYRYSIRYFGFKELNGQNKWVAYKFVKNIYDIWMPTHLKRICSVIDALPSDLSFEVSQQSELGESGPSQGLSCDAMSSKGSDGQSSCIGSKHQTPDTLLSQGIEEGVFEMPNKRARQS
ncbi:hypothetical protein BOTCAL_0695g00020 [Botryotinia calthae]|uniref:DUF7924 domain-containing protein n=1 Tax=Botryotinia calthae TaxID=38488 RepID=A0A4Y8CJV2_9HELO|nr:hypothetical protein BOTCAL_0695g00020 [Botryotinia calthae]